MTKHFVCVPRGLWRGSKQEDNAVCHRGCYGLEQHGLHSNGLQAHELLCYTLCNFAILTAAVPCAGSNWKRGNTVRWTYSHFLRDHCFSRNEEMKMSRKALKVIEDIMANHDEILQHRHQCRAVWPSELPGLDVATYYIVEGTLNIHPGDFDFCTMTH